MIIGIIRGVMDALFLFCLTVYVMGVTLTGIVVLLVQEPDHMTRWESLLSVIAPFVWPLAVLWFMGRSIWEICRSERNRRSP